MSQRNREIKKKTFNDDQKWLVKVNLNISFYFLLNLHFQGLLSWFQFQVIAVTTKAVENVREVARNISETCQRFGIDVFLFCASYSYDL